MNSYVECINLKAIHDDVSLMCTDIKKDKNNLSQRLHAIAQRLLIALYCKYRNDCVWLKYDKDLFDKARTEFTGRLSTISYKLFSKIILKDRIITEPIFLDLKYYRVGDEDKFLYKYGNYHCMRYLPNLTKSALACYERVAVMRDLFKTLPQEWFDEHKPTISTRFYAHECTTQYDENMFYNMGVFSYITGSCLPPHIFDISLPKLMIDNCKDGKALVYLHPPKVEDLLLRTCVLIPPLFVAARKHNIKLSVVFIGPTWNDASFHRRIISYRHFKSSIKLQPNKYYFADCLTRENIKIKTSSQVYVLENYDSGIDKTLM